MMYWRGYLLLWQVKQSTTLRWSRFGVFFRETNVALFSYNDHVAIIIVDTVGTQHNESTMILSAFDWNLSKRSIFDGEDIPTLVFWRSKPLLLLAEAVLSTWPYIAVSGLYLIPPSQPFLLVHPKPISIQFFSFYAFGLSYLRSVLSTIHNKILYWRDFWILMANPRPISFTRRLAYVEIKVRKFSKRLLFFCGIRFISFSRQLKWALILFFVTTSVVFAFL